MPNTKEVEGVNIMTIGIQYKERNNRLIKEEFSLLDVYQLEELSCLIRRCEAYKLNYIIGGIC